MGSGWVGQHEGGGAGKLVGREHEGQRGGVVEGGRVFKLGAPWCRPDGRGLTKEGEERGQGGGVVEGGHVFKLGVPWYRPDGRGPEC